MNKKIPSTSMAAGVGWLRLWLPLLALLLCGNARGAYQDIDINNCLPPPKKNCESPNEPPDVRCYAAELNTPINSINENISVIGASGDVFWDLAPNAGCTGAAPNFVCAGMNVTVPTGSVSPVAPNDAGKVRIRNSTSSLNTLALSSFGLTVSAAPDGIPTCTRQYRLRVTSNGGGWGDPHITTIDGVNYDFQSAGEFVSLRGGGLEIQTRQTPVATASVVGPNAHTGLTTCVSVYSAVAARVGTHRVSYQPNISGKPDPSGMQLRVDGVLTTLGPEGIDLDSGGPIITAPARRADVKPPVAGRIVKSPAGDGIEIHYADGTQLIVTPAFWDSQQKWYLNVAVNQTTATEGIMGQIAPGSWLPAIPGPEGEPKSLGPKPDDMHERYVALYETFANAWRVTDETSLFDYAPGTSTATFTNKNWPTENPSSCPIPGESLAQPLDALVAQEHCSKIADNNRKANCEFDVTVTGHPGFAQTYQLTEQLQSGATATTVKDDKDSTKYGESVTFTATVAPTLSRSGQGTPSGVVQFAVNGVKVGEPVALDSNGRAAWNTSLEIGKHQVVATYIPSGFGDIFLASSSPAESHTVIATSNRFPWWLVALLILAVIFVVWWFRKKT